MERLSWEAGALALPLCELQALLRHQLLISPNTITADCVSSPPTRGLTRGGGGTQRGLASLSFAAAVADVFQKSLNLRLS